MKRIGAVARWSSCLLWIACAGDDGAASEATGASTSMTSMTSMTSTTSTSSGATAESESMTGAMSSTSEATTSGTTTSGTTTTTGDPPGPGGTVPVGGGDFFLLGANYPWKSYGGDFGGNAWGTYGVHTKAPEIGAELAALRGDEMYVVRWFVFTDGRAGIVFDGQGSPTGLEEHVFKDMDEAVALAKQAGVYLIPVLLDFHWAFWAKSEGGVQMGGRRDTISDPAKRAALVELVVAPLLDRYAGAPEILAWEIMNEPEWVISDLPEPAVNGEADALSLADFYAFSAAVADEVHARTSAYVTLGSASLKWHRVWTPSFAAARQLPVIGIDVYQAHYYPWMDGQTLENHPELGTVALSPLVQEVEALGLDRPMVVGELAMSSDAGATLDLLLAKGYAGAWPWSVNADFSIDRGGVRAWGQARPELVKLPAP